jgi:mono/diheme cytochrome c family protein
MWKKITGYTLLTLFSVATGGFAYFYFRKPASRPPADIRVASTPDRIVRGKYIFQLADCDGCHSPRDPSKLYLPVIEARRGSGQIIPEEGLPGSVVASNITPDRETGIGTWTDGEKIRAIREGIGRDGRALFPMMPYTMYRHMSDEDVQALVAYLNTLAPVRNELPATKIDFPVNLLIQGEPQPVTRRVLTPSPSNPIVYGEYLATVGVCEGCHTTGASKRLAGGRKFDIAGYSVVSANITPDRETGIGNWTLEYFLERFRRHRNVPVDLLPANTKEQFTLMPWRNLSQLPDRDLAAIYAYLMSRPPIENRVNPHPVEIASR